MTLSTGTTGLSHVKKISTKDVQAKASWQIFGCDWGWGGTTSSASPIVLFVI